MMPISHAENEPEQKSGKEKRLMRFWFSERPHAIRGATPTEAAEEGRRYTRQLFSRDVILSSVLADIPKQNS